MPQFAAVCPHILHEPSTRLVSGRHFSTVHPEFTPVTVQASSKPLTLQSIYGSSGDISISYGQSVQMVVEGTDAPISWSVEDGSVLVVTEDGVITGVGGGNTNVVAKVEGQTLTCIVRVG